MVNWISYQTLPLIELDRVPSESIPIHIEDCNRITYGIILGFVGVFLAGFIQDWANEEEMFSWVKKLGK